MIFRTEIELQKSASKISYESNLVMFGSCFSENIGKKLVESKFRTDINPFGILYNPSSIKNSIRQLIDGKYFTESEVFFHKGVWNSFSHHGVFSDTSKEKTLQNINSRITDSASNLKNADFLILTFGTAWIYEEKESTQIVSNCHKLPEKTFVRRRLSIQEIVGDYSTLLADLLLFNPKIKVIFTVSPVRHWKDGAHENQLSKSTLLLAISELQTKFPTVDYFPAYEIVMDELRDYRFYEEDMLHPNIVTINYIWGKFSETYFSAETLKIKHEILQITKAENHKPFNPDTKEHQIFLQKLEEKKKVLRGKYPFLGL